MTSVNNNTVARIIEIANTKFKSGNNIVQAKNFRELIASLGLEYSIDLSDAVYLIENCPKIRDMVNGILHLKDYREQLESELFYSLATAYAEKFNIELALPEDDFSLPEEELEEDETTIDSAPKARTYNTSDFLQVDGVKQFLNDMNHVVYTPEEEVAVFTEFEKTRDPEIRKDILEHNVYLYLMLKSI